jgi:mannitol-1-phosphate 5-dehydrogenase
MSQQSPNAQGKTFVGFGFGAIQAGLFLLEAHASGAFGRLVVAEVVPETVAALRGAGGFYTVNVAHANGVEPARVGPVEACDPAVEEDRAALIDALALADEIATAVPSVKFYSSDAPGSIHRLLAAGLARKVEIDGPRAVVYAAENHNHAAQILAGLVEQELDAGTWAALRERVRFLNTVISKMSGVVEATDALAPVTPGGKRAFLVEDFNRILVTQPDFPAEKGGAAFARAIEVFQEKPDLLPFKEAKLYGHNGLHALAGYLGAARGLAFMSELSGAPGILDFVRAAVLEEPGAALVEKYAGADTLFTGAGFAAYADDLLVRMTNPHLQDRIERVCRDPERKLGWDDRLIGPMRLALANGATPRRFAAGAAAALRVLEPDATEFPAARLAAILEHGGAPRDEAARVAALATEGGTLLAQWQAAGFPPLEEFYQSQEGRA